MRSFLRPSCLLLLLALCGCRAPAIPDDPTATEYAVWHDVLRYEAGSHASDALIVSPSTLPLDEGQLQFQRCLPAQMRDIFDAAPSATLSVNVPEDWLRLPAGSVATLSDGRPQTPTASSMHLRLSRVAFSRFHREAYVWVEEQRCSADGGAQRCEGHQGEMLRLVPAGEGWTAERTDCQAVAFNEGG